jgi:tmRNA-binding protein
LNRFDSKVFKIYSMKKKKIIFETKIVHEPLIQRLKSGLYTLVDGHIYFNNNVIKIRYDLMEKKDSHILLEDEVFDYYTDIF